MGPGDVEFSSSPPVTSESSTMAHYLSQSTGSIPQQILTQHSNRPQQSQIRLPASPQQWTLQKQHVSQGNVNSHQARQLQHTQSQDKLTLLERAKLMAEYQKTKGSSNLGSPGSLPSLSASHDAAFFTEGIDRSTAVASTAGYTNSQPVASLPRMGSPIERGNRWYYCCMKIYYRYLILLCFLCILKRHPISQPRTDCEQMLYLPPTLRAPLSLLALSFLL